MSGPGAPLPQAVPTTQGPAAVRVFAPTGRASATPRGTLLVGHGAGGQRDAADVLALTGLTADGWTVVLVDQPWRVAGRRVATAPPTLDEAWTQVVAALAEGGAAPDGTALPRPWVYAGRSAGARVACRTSVLSAPPPAAVVSLAFPLHPPGRPDRSRAQELAAPLRAGIPTLVVQGGRDPMGTPAEIRDEIRGALDDPAHRPSPALTLHEVPGAHSPTRDLDALVDHVRAFLDHVDEDRLGDHRDDASGGRSGVASVDRTSSRTGAPSP